MLVAACLFVAVVCAAALPASGASTGGTVVGAYVPSATNLSTTGCASGVAGRTEFGTMLPGAASVTSSDCVVTFGSSNDVGRLRVRQSDGTGAAMHQTSTGVPDPSFSGDGWAEAFLPGVDVTPQAIAVQPDGKVVSGGRCIPGITSNDFCLARLTTTGGIDTSFDTDGFVITDFGAGNDQVYELVVQPDGRIVGVGGCDMGATWNDFCFARYLATGALDTSFSGDGKLVVPIGPGASHDEAEALAVLPDGSIVAGGRCDMGGSTGFDHCMVRITASGALDTTFGQGGIATTSIGPGTAYDQARGLAVLRSGTIVLGGDCAMGGATATDGCYSAWTSAGKLDTTFGGGDVIVTTSFVPSGSGEYANSIAAGRSGFVAAQDCLPAGNPTGYDICLSQYDDTGALDTGFSGDGMLMINVVPGNQDDNANSVLVQPDGKVVVAGYCEYPAPRRFDLCMARLLPDGAFDPTFSGDGMLDIEYTPTNLDDWPQAVVMGVDGKLLIANDCDPTGAQPICVLQLGAGAGVPQYADGSNDWDTPNAGLFAICLRAVGSATATWTAHASCPATDGVYWNPVPIAATQVAAANSATSTATASLRFGMRVPPSQAPGAYVAPITFEVLAP